MIVVGGAEYGILWVVRCIQAWLVQVEFAFPLLFKHYYLCFYFNYLLSLQQFFY